MAFHAYLLRCNDGSYYAGHTDDLDLRLPSTSRACWAVTPKRRPVALVWAESFPTRDEAFAAERKLKGWSRAKKEALIVGDWPLISQLARGRSGCGEGGQRGAGASTSSA